MHSNIIYLDTQDYSNLTDALSGRVGYEHFLPIYHQLRKFAQEGSFRFCFSYMIVSELLQLNQEGIEIARRKASLVEELCGSHAFPHIFWLLASELTTASERHGHTVEQNRPTLEEVAFGGRWIQVEIANSLQVFDDLDSQFSKQGLNQAALAQHGRSLNRIQAVEVKDTPSSNITINSQDVRETRPPLKTARLFTMRSIASRGASSHYYTMF